MQYYLEHLTDYGGLEEAVHYAAKQAKLKENEYEIRVLPRPKNPFEQLFGDLADGDQDDEGRISPEVERKTKLVQIAIIFGRNCSQALIFGGF